MHFHRHYMMYGNLIIDGRAEAVIVRDDTSNKHRRNMAFDANENAL